MRNKIQISSLLCLAVVMTNLSQLPVFVDSGSTQLVTYSCWGLLLFVCCLRPKLEINVTALNLLWAFAAVIVLPFLLGKLTDCNYAGTRIFYNLIITAGVFLISSFIPLLDIEDMNAVYRAYVISATIVAVVIYINYFQTTGFNFESTIYEYDSKNSSSQIVLTAIVLSTFDFGSRNTKWGGINLACLCINSLVLLLMRSRASIIGIVVIVVMTLFDKNVDKRVRRAVLVASVVFICVLCFNESVYDTVVNKILFASRDRTDWDSVSSGRLSDWETFPSLFAEHPLLGRGRYKLESLPLSVLVQYGLCFGLPILALAVYPTRFAWKRRTQGKHFQILLVTSVTYLLNGIFEELSPFGPGVKCYFIWLMLGILIRSCEYGGKAYTSRSESR